MAGVVVVGDSEAEVLAAAAADRVVVMYRAKVGNEVYSKSVSEGY